MIMGLSPPPAMRIRRPSTALWMIRRSHVLCQQLEVRAAHSAPLRRDYGAELRGGPVQVVVDDDVIVLGNGQKLLTRPRQAPSNGGLRIFAPPVDAAAQLLQAGRPQKHQNRLAHPLADLACALDVDIHYNR